jgi:NADPH:quinone reductase-like Zn-dependent oxidoreductase
MSDITFKAMVVSEAGERQYDREIATKTIDDLPPGDVVVQVHYSSLNYKDALSASGNKGVTRNYPHTPGIDAAGVVAESAGGQFKPGDQVIVTSYDLGMNTAGGFG